MEIGEVGAKKPVGKSDDFLSFLSFLSLFVSIIREMSNDLNLTSILLGPEVDVQEPTGIGSFFSITIIGGGELLQHARIPPEKLDALPRFVALKKPLLNGDPNKPSNQRILHSMATELQVLRDMDLFAHKNIISLLGVCWTPGSERPLPVFVQEAAELGDLEQFLSTQQLTIQEEVRTCIDIASGIYAIHKKGVIHCDLNPRNILICKNGQDSFIAKLGDFGSSVLLSARKPSSQLHGGTKMWQAPEIDEICEADELIKAEIYSLGLVMWYLFTTDVASSILESSPRGLKASKVNGDLLETAVETVAGLYTDESQESNSEQIQLKQCLMTSTLACQGNERWDAEGILNCLNNLMDVTIEKDKLKVQELGPRSAEIPDVEFAATASVLTLGDVEYIQNDQDGDGILNASRYFATVQLIPPTVCAELKSELDLVAGDENESDARRAKAALQYAIITLGLLRPIDASSEELEAALAMLCLAASSGSQMAQCIVGQLHETFDKPAPFDSDTEIPWLINGTVGGSMTARRRLLRCCLEEHDRAVHKLRHEYGGIGIDANFDEHELDGVFDLITLEESELSTRLLLRLACLGKVEQFQRALGLGRVNVDCVNTWGETVLLVACRSGHSEIAKILLEAGADASIPSDDGLTPLHFLGAFDEREIPQIAAHVLRNKATLEARSNNGRIHHYKLDTQFGPVEGTPLLWAVSSGSLAATKVLVENGADPFDVKSGSMPVTKSWGDQVHLSPIDLAALNHQDEFLHVMLSHSWLQSATKCASRLNNNFRFIEPNPNFAALPLFWAVNYMMPDYLLRRLLLHGNDHQAACKRTIQILVDYGSNPAELDNQGRSILEIATLQGQPFLTAYAICHQSKLPKLTPPYFLELLFNTVKIHDYTSFQLLVDHGEGINIDTDDDLVSQFLARTVEITDNVRFIDLYLDSRKCVTGKNIDNEVFERALLSCNWNAAQRVFQAGQVNLHKRITNEQGNESTVFCRLLARSKKYYNTVDKIRFFLSLTKSPDDLFFNIGLIDHMHMTALHSVSLYAEYRPDLASSLPVMNAILEYYYQPHHLNAQVSGGRFSGYTALHLAIEGGNIDAAGRLLNEGAATDILNQSGESAFDLVKVRWRSQTRYMTHLPHNQWRSAREAHDRVTERLTDLLLQHDAKPERYLAMFQKISLVSIRMEVFSTHNSEDLLLNSTNLSSIEGLGAGLAKVCCELKPDHIFLFGMTSQEQEGEVIGVSANGKKTVKTYLDQRLLDLLE